MRLYFLPEDQKYVLPYKISLVEGNIQDDSMEGHIGEVKKHTEMIVDPLKNNLEELTDIIREMRREMRESLKLCHDKIDKMTKNS